MGFKTCKVWFPVTFQFDREGNPINETWGSLSHSKKAAKEALSERLIDLEENGSGKYYGRLQPAMEAYFEQG